MAAIELNREERKMLTKAIRFNLARALQTNTQIVPEKLMEDAYYCVTPVPGKPEERKARYKVIDKVRDWINTYEGQSIIREVAEQFDKNRQEGYYK